MKIGIFDSGVGGITVLKEALKQLPQVEYIYYSDNLHVPYGTKTKEEVLGYVNDVVDILIDEKVDAILIACNTATSIAAHILREKYKDIPIIGMEPAVKLAVDQTKSGRVLVTATPLTLKEEKYKQLVSKVDIQERTDALALPDLYSLQSTLNLIKQF
ncbi:glutamate racemase [Cellulosilyticum ruminicola]|uniref:glutamate racemase n=1 Tax=Cellulosilyticum ruminicola TaxID=425254 RepID=UPI000ACFA0B9|nr:glutamate racemase [Cellulosilyticum ruminicola]